MTQHPGHPQSHAQNTTFPESRQRAEVGMISYFPADLKILQEELMCNMTELLKQCDCIDSGVFSDQLVTESSFGRVWKQDKPEENVIRGAPKKCYQEKSIMHADAAE